MFTMELAELLNDSMPVHPSGEFLSHSGASSREQSPILQKHPSARSTELTCVSGIQQQSNIDILSSETAATNMELDDSRLIESLFFL